MDKHITRSTLSKRLTVNASNRFTMENINKKDIRFELYLWGNPESRDVPHGNPVHLACSADGIHPELLTRHARPRRAALLTALR